MLSVLYLYDNSIYNTFNLQTCSNLTRLHLANNNLSSLKDCFKGLFNLTYLNLRSNYIESVEGMEDLPFLETLHLDKQNLKSGQEISFSADSIAGLAVCMLLFDIHFYTSISIFCIGMSQDPYNHHKQSKCPPLLRVPIQFVKS